jgi:hypothetical protein
MKVEKVLKDIKGLLEKHQDFLNNNPEIFFAIEDRLFKAIDPDEDEDYEGDENYKDDLEDEDGQGLGLFDDEQAAEDEEPNYEDEDEAYVHGSKSNEDEDSDAERWLRENDPTYAERAEEVDEDPSIEEPSEDELPQLDLPEGSSEEYDEPKPEKKSSGRMREWKPKDSYKPEHDAKIKEFIGQGFSHREAERLAGAHEAPTNFYDALRHSVRPSEPSPKMLEIMRDHARKWKENHAKVTESHAEADVNPQKYASAKSLAAHDAVHKDFATEYQKFLDSDETKKLTGRARHQAIQAWKNKWHEENPEHREAAKQAAAAGTAFKEANAARKQRRDEGMASILTAGFSSGEDNPMAGEFSSGAAGETPETRGMSAAGQMVGAEQDEDGGGFQTNTKKDPNLVFAEQFPEYVKNAKEKLATKLKPEQLQRMTAVDSFKNKGKGDK